MSDKARVYVLVRKITISYGPLKIGNDYSEILGIFSSRKLAEKRRQELFDSGGGEALVEQYLVDP